MKKNVSINELLNLIPADLLDRLGEETRVNHQVKKLSGQTIFKLLMFALADRKDLSWRILERIFNHFKFQQFAGISEQQRTDHSSLATRLANIQVAYFEQIHEVLCQELLKRFPVQKIGGYKIVRFDSTLVSIAASLLKQMDGIEHGVNKSCRQPSDHLDIKFTIGFDGLNPVRAKFFTQQAYLSEDLALGEVIGEHVFCKKDLVVFDRGLNKRESFDDFTETGLMFVTRLKTYKGQFRHQLVGQFTAIDPQHPVETPTLFIEEDQEIYLFNKKSKRTRHTYRLIKAKSKKCEETYYFLTNEKQLTTQDVTLIYKHRWDIEVLFKFLKQEFGFKHILSRNPNGIQVMLYMTLITFTLIHLYYKLNKIESFKIAKLQFVQAIEFEVMKIIVAMCKGDPNLLNAFAPT